jgi:hypothetical protein
MFTCNYPCNAIVMMHLVKLLWGALLGQSNWSQAGEEAKHVRSNKYRRALICKNASLHKHEYCRGCFWSRRHVAFFLSSCQWLIRGISVLVIEFDVFDSALHTSRSVSIFESDFSCYIKPFYWYCPQNSNSNCRLIRVGSGFIFFSLECFPTNLFKEHWTVSSDCSMFLRKEAVMYVPRGRAFSSHFPSKGAIICIPRVLREPMVPLVYSYLVFNLG